MSAIKGSLLFYLLIGLVQAGVLLAFKGHDHLWVLVAWAVTLVVGINLQLLGANIRLQGTWMGVAGLAVLFGAISAGVVTDTSTGGLGDFWLGSSWNSSSIVAGYIATAFILAWPTHKRYRLHYETLFQCAWNNAFIVLLALLLCGLFWLLLELCSGLFHLLGIDVFKRVFATTEFIYISVAVVFSLGMRMGRQNEKIIGMLRGICLAVCRFLMPMAALIVLLFTLTLPFTGLESIWKTGHSTEILLVLVGVSVFLINGVFQDGRQPTRYPQWLVYGVSVSLLCLPALTVLAGYSTWLRIEQYGLSPSRFMGMVLVLLAGLYSLAAAYAVLGRQSVWLGSLRTSNQLLALVTFVVLVAVHSVWFSPLEFSARNQVQRLLDGRTPVAKFDAQNLRDRLGRPGREHFDRLLAKAESEQLFDGDTRRLLLANLRAAKEGKAASSPPKDITWIGPKVDGSEQFAEPDVCPDSACVLWAVDLEGDGQNEVLQLSARKTWNPIEFFTRTPEGKWVKAGILEGQHNVAQIVDLIRAGKAAVVKPRYGNLDIGGTLFIPRLSVKAVAPATHE